MRPYSKACLFAFDVALIVSVLAIARTEDLQGKLVAVYPGKNEFMVADNSGKTWNFKFVPDGKVMIDNKPGKLEDLFAGEHVSVIFERPMDMPEATEIRCSRK